MTTERRNRITPVQTPLEALLALGAGVTLPALTPDEIDSFISEYELADRAAKTADEHLTHCKLAVIALVQQHGSVPAHAEQSKRLEGRRNQATVTVATTLEINEAAVVALENYLDERDLHELFNQLFATNTKHTLVKGADAVLATVQIRKPEDAKIRGLFGSCIKPKPKAPSLKVELIAPEKPTRTPRAGKKAA